MFDKILLLILVLLNFVACGKVVSIEGREKKNSADGFISKLRGDHIIQRRSFGPIELHNGLVNILGNNEVIPASSSFLPRAHPFHSYLPYPPNNHGPLPGSYPSPFGQSHQRFPGDMQYHGHGYHGNQACGGYSCHHGGNFNQYPGYGHHNHGNDVDYEDCNLPDHSHMGPHHHQHHHHGQGTEPAVTNMPHIETPNPTGSTPKVVVPTVSTKGTTISQPTISTKSTTTTKTPIYDIDIRFGNGTG